MLEKYVKYESKKIVERDKRFSLAPTFRLIGESSKLINGSVSFSGGTGIYEESSESYYLAPPTTITFPSSTFSFGVEDFAIEVVAKVAGHPSNFLWPYFLSSSRYNAGPGFNMLVRGETTGFAVEATIYFSTSSAVTASQVAYLSSTSILRYSGFNHIAIIRIGLIHYLYINGNLEATSTQTSKTNYGVETARFNSDSQNAGNGNEVNVSKLNTYVGANLAQKYFEWLSNSNVVRESESVVANRRMYESAKTMRESRVEYYNLLPRPIFKISSRSLRETYSSDQKILSIYEEISGGTRSPFQNDINKAPKYVDGDFLSFGLGDFLTVPVPLNDTNFPASNYRVGFFVVERKSRRKIGGDGLFSSLVSGDTFFHGSFEGDYVFAAGIGTKVYGIKSNIIVPNRYLLVEIIRDGYYEVRLNGRRVSDSFSVIKNNVVMPQYSIEKIGGTNFSGSIGEIVLYSFSDGLDEEFIMKKEVELIKRWKIERW